MLPCLPEARNNGLRGNNAQCVDAGLTVRCAVAVCVQCAPSAIIDSQMSPAVLLTRTALLACTFDLTKKARAISCNAPPLFGRLAPDSPVPLAPPGSQSGRGRCYSKSASPPGAAPKSIVFDLRFEKRQQRHQYSIARLPSCPLRHHLSINVLPVAYQRSKYASLPESHLASQRLETVRSTNHPRLSCTHT